jgi:uncharacterized protein YkwD
LKYLIKIILSTILLFDSKKFFEMKENIVIIDLCDDDKNNETINKKKRKINEVIENDNEQIKKHKVSNELNNNLENMSACNNNSLLKNLHKERIERKKLLKKDNKIMVTKEQQLNERNLKERRKYLNAKKSIINFDDIKKNKLNLINNQKLEYEDIGKLALKYTNEFRIKNNKCSLNWSKEIAIICTEHSKNMCEKKVSFGHDGFDDRIKKFTFDSSISCENVAMNKGCSNIAKTAVDGWINSPGHRKNLLSDTNICGNIIVFIIGIGVYKNNNNEYYLCQIFSKNS